MGSGFVQQIERLRHGQVTIRQPHAVLVTGES
jgi:hypothetical protein